MLHLRSIFTPACTSTVLWTFTITTLFFYDEMMMMILYYDEATTRPLHIHLNLLLQKIQSYISLSLSLFPSALHDFLGHDNDNNNYQLRNGAISFGDLLKEIRYFYWNLK